MGLSRKQETVYMPDSEADSEVSGVVNRSLSTFQPYTSSTLPTLAHILDDRLEDLWLTGGDTSCPGARDLLLSSIAD